MLSNSITIELYLKFIIIIKNYTVTLLYNNLFRWIKTSYGKGKNRKKIFVRTYRKIFSGLGLEKGFGNKTEK